MKKQTKFKRLVKKHFDLSIIVSLMLLSTAISGFWMGHLYGINITKDQENETKILPYCYVQNEVLITALNKTCFDIYGGPVVK